ncbi:MAG: hypothetical protein EFT35_04875 [Methanophagales archaeon ANME-1-THS]|nr:MAG: hypothetical protein EFT35_04875 [Methanophagales archaeon ANME-1-THS]
MIIAVSDVHLGYEKSNREDFIRFLDTCNSADIHDLVLLGDILDFWRRNNAKVVTDEIHAEIVDKLGNLDVKHIHYVVGNHDYYLLRLSDRYEGNYPFTVSKFLRLEDRGSKFYFIHGYELEVLANLEPLSIETYEHFSEKMCFTKDVLGWFLSHLWELLERRGGIWRQTSMMKKPPHERTDIDKIYNLAISKGRYLLLGMKPNEKLVYGHTHRPFINKERTVANTGSWVAELSKKSQNWYLMIADGQMELKAFDEKAFP